MPPEAIDAIREAGQNFVLLDELQQKAGAYIATLLGVDSSYISSGAAGGMLLCAAACITGCNSERIISLPDTRDWPNEILARSTTIPNFVYQAMRAAGAKVIEVGSLNSVTIADFEKSLTPSTVALQIYLGRNNQPEVSEIAALARAHSLKLIVDAAGELPPRCNFTTALNAGADAVVFSGGKAIRGPQSTGLIVGSRSFIRACRLNGNPNKAIGRGLKVSKEDICGFVAALEAFVLRTDERDTDECIDKSGRIASALSLICGLDVSVHAVDSKARPDVPRVYLRCLLPGCSCMGTLSDCLLEGTPPILVREDEAGICIDVMCLGDADLPIVCSRIQEAVLYLSANSQGLAHYIEAGQ